MRTVERFFEDYAVGEARVTTGRTITETDIVLHAGQTGDFYPHHVDAEWCATQSFGHRMAHGTLTMAIAVGMTADEINPRAMSYGYDRVRFILPVLVGDTLTVSSEITSKREHPRRRELGYIDETITASNQRSEIVLSLVHVHVVQKRS